MSSIPLNLTESAKKHLKDMIATQEGAIGILLSIARGKGCGGNEYRMTHLIEEKPGLDKIEIDEKTALYIPVTDSFMMFGMDIDYVQDGLGNAHFVITNPNEAARCGCGESFSLDEEKLKERQGFRAE